VVQSLDAAAHTVTIAHDAVPALDWPEMTMTFAAPGVDLSAIKAGDAVRFELTATGMDGTITAISKQ
jgi:Cu(I)/Ag(I) efflux system protein CusF